MMVMEGCQGKKGIEIFEKKCPRCGHTVEIFSIDVSVKCENCGFEVYNDALNCVQWCKYAEKCVGPETYKHLKEVAEMQKKRREEEKLLKQA